MNRSTSVALFFTSWRLPLFVSLLLAGSVAVYLTPAPFAEWPAQWASYHDFADRRALWGVPNFGDVMSNLPFLLTGSWGFFVCAHTTPGPGARLTEPWERRAWMAVFAGVFATGFGSAYYHWSPNNDTLFWDRLPMAVVFALIVTLVLAERVSWKWGKNLAIPAVALAIGSVVFWTVTERLGHGDLRPYGLVQGMAMLALPLMLLFWRGRYNRAADLWCVLAGYIAAKGLEQWDRAVFAAFGGLVSGHTLKHLAAAAATGFMVLHLRRRKESGTPAAPP
ncbi:MAG: ceramidase domain-containing protein [Verrucomicrobiales bacterium]